MSAALSALKCSCLCLLLVAFTTATFAIANQREGSMYRAIHAYVAYLDRQAESLLITLRGRRIALGQVLVIVTLLGLSVYFERLGLCLLVPTVLAAPSLALEMMRRKRVQTLEAKLDSFLLTLSNSLRATPSIAHALEQTQAMVGGPMQQEVRLAIKEMRLGTPLDQALLNLTHRIRSDDLDAALASLLIGRQVGGELPKILDTTATNLREMARLRGVVRSKTAESKWQLGVLAVFPVVVVFLFDVVSDGYFDPLMKSVVGVLIVAVAVGLWVTALVVAERMLRVEL